MVFKVVNHMETADLLTSELMKPKDLSPSVSEFYLENIKQSLAEVIDGLKDLDAGKDIPFIKQMCDECQDIIGGIQKLNLNQPANKLKLLAISSTLNALKKFLLLER